MLLWDGWVGVLVNVMARRVAMGWLGWGFGERNGTACCYGMVGTACRNGAVGLGYG